MPVKWGSLAFGLRLSVKKAYFIGKNVSQSLKSCGK
jgi:hypothetical protein